MSEDGELQCDGLSAEPFVICAGSRYVLDLAWDLTDASGQDVPAGDYTFEATVETPSSRDPGSCHLLDCTEPAPVHVTVQDCLLPD